MASAIVHSINSNIWPPLWKAGPPAAVNRAANCMQPAFADNKRQPPLLSGPGGLAGGRLLHLRGHLGDGLLLRIGEISSSG